MGKALDGKELGKGFSQCQNGRYKYSFRLQTGKQTAVYGGSVAECKKEYKARMQELEAGLTAANKKVTVSAYYTEWIAGLQTNGTKESTIRRYKSMWDNHLKSEFGTCKVTAVTVLMAKSFQRKLVGQGLKPTTVNNIVGLANHIFTDCERDEIITRNPFGLLKQIPKETNNDSDDDEEFEGRNNRALNTEETKMFLDAMETSFYADAAKLLFATGMRQGELRALRWTDYDRRNDVLHIRRTVSLDADGNMIFTTPKTKDSRRDVPLNDEIISILESQKRNMRMLHGNVIQMNGLIFTNLKGGTIGQSILNGVFSNACKNLRAAGHTDFDDISPHSARHTFITRWLLNGGNIHLLRDIVGHSKNSAITESCYRERDLNAAAEAMKSYRAV